MKWLSSNLAGRRLKGAGSTGGTPRAAARRAVCTGDRRKLSNRLEFTVSGPDG